MNKVFQGDCLEVLKTIKENTFDSIVTDPPYELGFMGKAWDNTGIELTPEYIPIIEARLKDIPTINQPLF